MKSCTAIISNYNKDYLYIFSPEGPKVDKSGRISDFISETEYLVFAENKDKSSKSEPSLPFAIEGKLREIAIPVIRATAATERQNGKAIIQNFSKEFTYKINPSGPELSESGEILKLTPDLFYTITAFYKKAQSQPSEKFKIDQKLKISEKLETPKVVIKPNFVKFGNQKWAASYVTLIEYRNGEKLFFASTSKDWQKAIENKIPAYCLPSDDIEFSQKIGYLYNWYALKCIENDLKKLNFKIPEKKDIIELQDFLMNHKNQEFVENFYSNASQLKYRFPMATYVEDSENRYFWTSNDDDKYYTAIALKVGSNKSLKLQKISKNAGFFIRCLIEN
ncbi:MAG: hypothetical protein ACKO7P_01445 [Bacteroidota bacterium]